MRRATRGIVEKTLSGLADATARVVAAEGMAERNGLLQRLDPRAKLVGLLALVLAAAFSHSLLVITALLVVAVTLALLSRIPVTSVLSGVWLGSLGLTLALALPALVFTPGDPATVVPLVGWTITRQGLTAAARLVLRVETAATLGFLLVSTTPWGHVLKALRALHVPVVFVVILGMTYRYILLMLETAHEMFEGRRSRTVGRMPPAEHRRAALQTAGVLLNRVNDLGNDVYLAMQARGFRGEVHLLDEFRMRVFDWVALTSLVGLAAMATWMGR
jgi:cobalt ECF transporter T component CbiQ